jgi:exonuclease VII small subunit
VEKYQQGIALSAECKKRLDAAKEVVISKMTPSGEVPLK